MKIIEKLHPAIREIANEFVLTAKVQNIDLRIYQGLRTFEEQNKLYAQGRTTPGKIVTQAKGGQSFHNYGLAIDVIPFVKGNPDWNTKLWPEISAIGEGLGFEWGGRWKFVDKPHFQFPKGKNFRQLQELKNFKKIDENGYILLNELK